MFTQDARACVKECLFSDAFAVLQDVRYDRGSRTSCETREQSLQNKHTGQERQLGARHKRVVNDTDTIHKCKVHQKFKTKVRSAKCDCEGELARLLCKFATCD